MAARGRRFVALPRHRARLPRGANLGPATVGALLKSLPVAGGYDLFRIERDDGLYRVEGQFAEKAFRKHSRQLAAFFMSAAEAGIHGDVYFLGQGVREGYAIQLSGGRPTLATLEDEEIERRSMDPILDAISAHFRAAPESVAPPAPAPPGPISSRPLLQFPREAARRGDGARRDGALAVAADSAPGEPASSSGDVTLESDPDLLK